VGVWLNAALGGEEQGWRIGDPMACRAVALWATFCFNVIVKVFSFHFISFMNIIFTGCEIFYL
jgi:hypothetical protein